MCLPKTWKHKDFWGGCIPAILHNVSFGWQIKIFSGQKLFAENIESVICSAGNLWCNGYGCIHSPVILNLNTSLQNHPKLNLSSLRPRFHELHNHNNHHHHKPNPTWKCSLSEWWNCVKLDWHCCCSVRLSHCNTFWKERKLLSLYVIICGLLNSNYHKGTNTGALQIQGGLADHSALLYFELSVLWTWPR